MRRAIVSVSIVVLAGLLLAGPTAAKQSAGAVEVRLARVAKLGPTGVITGRVKASCAPGTSVLEALVTASQDDQRIFGQGSILGPIRCNGKARWYDFRVSSQGESPFHTGPTYTSAYLLVYNGDDVASDGDTRVIQVK